MTLEATSPAKPYRMRLMSIGEGESPDKEPRENSPPRRQRRRAVSECEIELSNSSATKTSPEKSAESNEILRCYDILTEEDRHAEPAVKDELVLSWMTECIRKKKRYSDSFSFKRKQTEREYRFRLKRSSKKPKSLQYLKDPIFCRYFDLYEHPSEKSFVGISPVLRMIKENYRNFDLGLVYTSSHKQEFINQSLYTQNHNQPRKAKRLDFNSRRTPEEFLNTFELNTDLGTSDSPIGHLGSSGLKALVSRHKFSFSPSGSFGLVHSDSSDKKPSFGKIEPFTSEKNSGEEEGDEKDEIGSYSGAFSASLHRHISGGIISATPNNRRSTSGLKALRGFSKFSDFNDNETESNISDAQMSRVQSVCSPWAGRGRMAVSLKPLRGKPNDTSTSKFKVLEYKLKEKGKISLFILLNESTSLKVLLEPCQEVKMESILEIDEYGRSTTPPPQLPAFKHSSTFDHLDLNFDETPDEDEGSPETLSLFGDEKSIPESPTLKLPSLANRNRLKTPLKAVLINRTSQTPSKHLLELPTPKNKRDRPKSHDTISQTSQSSYRDLESPKEIPSKRNPKKGIPGLTINPILNSKDSIKSRSPNNSASSPGLSISNPPDTSNSESLSSQLSPNLIPHQRKNSQDLPNNLEANKSPFRDGKQEILTIISPPSPNQNHRGIIDSPTLVHTVGEEDPNKPKEESLKPNQISFKTPQSPSPRSNRSPMNTLTIAPFRPARDPSPLMATPHPPSPPSGTLEEAILNSSSRYTFKSLRPLMFGKNKVKHKLFEICIRFVMINLFYSTMDECFKSVLELYNDICGSLVHSSLLSGSLGMRRKGSSIPHSQTQSRPRFTSIRDNLPMLRPEALDTSAATLTDTSPGAGLDTCPPSPLLLQHTYSLNTLKTASKKPKPLPALKALHQNTNPHNSSTNPLLHQQRTFSPHHLQLPSANLSTAEQGSGSLINAFGAVSGGLSGGSLSFEDPLSGTSSIAGQIKGTLKGKLVSLEDCGRFGDLYERWGLQGVDIEGNVRQVPAFGFAHREDGSRKVNWARDPVELSRDHHLEEMLGFGEQSEFVEIDPNSNRMVALDKVAYQIEEEYDGKKVIIVQPLFISTPPRVFIEDIDPALTCSDHAEILKDFRENRKQVEERQAQVESKQRGQLFAPKDIQQVIRRTIDISC